MDGTAPEVALPSSKTKDLVELGRYQVDDVDTCFVRPTFTL